MSLPSRASMISELKLHLESVQAKAVDREETVIDAHVPRTVSDGDALDGPRDRRINR